MVDSVRVKVDFDDLRLGDRVAFKSRRGVAGGAVASLIRNGDGSLFAFRVDGETNPSVYYQRSSFRGGHRISVEVGLVKVNAIHLRNKVYTLELDFPLKEGDNIQIEGKAYTVYGEPVFVMKESSWVEGNYALDYQAVTIA